MVESISEIDKINNKLTKFDYETNITIL